MKRGRPLRVDPQRAAERRAQREARRATEARPEDAYERPQDAAKRDQGTPAERRAFRALAAQGCAMCEAFPPTPAERRELGHDLRFVEVHHVLSKDVLKRTGQAAQLWDVRNGLVLCLLHHTRQEKAFQRVPLDLLGPDTLAFADEVGLRFLLEQDRRYAC